MARRGARVCPECGEPVTPFAAGCALCGADLEAWRRRRESPGRLAQLPAARLRRPTLASERSKDVALVAVLLLMAVVSPILCLLFAVLGARDRHLQGRLAARNAIAAIGIANFALLFVPSLRFGLFQLLL